MCHCMLQAQENAGDGPPMPAVQVLVPGLPALLQHQPSQRSWLPWVQEKLGRAPPQPPLRGPLSTVRRAVFIGVHGWSVFGGIQQDMAPVSLGFAANLSATLDALLAESGLDAGSVERQLVGLVGGGKIADRVHQCTAQLAQHRAAIEAADLVVVAAHSQGGVVAAMLLEALLRGGEPWLRPAKQRVALLTMASVSHGPFADGVSDYFSATRELFELNSSISGVGASAMQSTAAILRAGVRVLAVASFADQVVPLFSAVLHGLDAAPTAQRAAWDPRTPCRLRGNLMRGVAYTAADSAGPNGVVLRLAHLCLAVRNAGEFADDLLVLLSSYARGSLLATGALSGGAHSALHSSQGSRSLFSLALQWALLERAEPDVAAFPCSVVATSAATVLAPLLTQKFAKTAHAQALLVEQAGRLVATARGLGMGSAVQAIGMELGEIAKQKPSELQALAVSLHGSFAARPKM